MAKQEEVQYIDLNNQTKIAYIDCGDNKKETLLFIHGLANYLWVWKWNIASLQEKYRCIAIDLPGNGFSSRGDYPYSIEYFTDTVHQFIDALNLKQVSLVGHSMGGQIALQFALKYGSTINKLILSAPAGFEYYSPHDATLFKAAISFGNFLAMDETHISQSINSSFYRHEKIASEIISDLNSIIQSNDRILYRKMLELCIDSMLDKQVFKHLKEINNKTLVFFGENDQLIPNRFLHPVTTKEIAEKGAKQMKHAEVMTFKNTGHFVHIEQAELVNSKIVQFMGAE